MTSIDELLAIPGDNITDIKAWINKTITQNTTDKNLTDLIMKLQFVSQDMQHNLDSIQDQLIQSTPGFQSIVHEIESNSHILNKDFQNISKDVSIMNTRNQTMMGELSTIYNTQKSIQLCMESVSEINNWEIKIKNLEKLFIERNEEKDNLSSIAQQLKLMKTRVLMLKNNMPDIYHKRYQIVKEYELKLETICIPYLNESFETSNYINFKFYSNIFCILDKEKEVEEQYFMNRLENIRLLSAHFSHSMNARNDENKNSTDFQSNRMSHLNQWLPEYLSAILEFFVKENEWCQQISVNNENANQMLSKLVVDICDEILIDIQQWLKIFISNNTSLEKIRNLVSIFQIFNKFYVNTNNCRLMNVEIQSPYLMNTRLTRDPLKLNENFGKLIYNLLKLMFKQLYIQLENEVMFSVFESGDGHCIRFIGENVENSLSFLDIIDRMNDSFFTVSDLMDVCSERFLCVSYGSLVVDIIKLFDVFIVHYIAHVDQLFERCAYNSSSVRSIKENDDDGNIENVMKSNVLRNNWILDLKSSFNLLIKINEMENKLQNIIQVQLLKFCESIKKLCG